MATTNSNLILDKAKKEQEAVTSTTATPQAANAPVSTATPKTSSQIEAVSEALAASSTRIAGSIKQLEKGARETKTITGAMTAAVESAASASQVINITSNNADLQAQNATIDAFDAAGGIPAQTILIEELTNDEDRLSKLLDEKLDIVDNEPTGIQFFDAIINEFSSLSTDLEIEAATAKRDQTFKQLQNTGAVTETAARTHALTKQTINQGTIEANTKLIQAESTIKAKQAELDSINVNAAAMTRLTTADQRNVSNLIQGFRLEGEVEERKLKVERQKFAREQMGFQREKWEVELPAAKVALEKATIALEDTKGLTPDRRLALEANFKSATKRFNDQVAFEEDLVDSVQRGQELAGVPREDAAFIVASMRNPRTAAKYIRLQELGGIEDPVLGNTPFEAKESLTIVAPTGNIKATPATLLLDQVTKLQLEQYKTEGKVPKDEEVIRKDFNDAAATLAEVAAADIRMSDGTNPYQAPSMDVLAASSSVAESTLYKKVLAPLAMKETNPQRIIDATIAGLRAKTVSPEEAASGIEAIFEAAAAYNNTFAGGFRRVGLPNQITYNTSIVRAPTAFEELKGTVGATTSIFKPSSILGAVTGDLEKVAEGAGKAFLESTLKSISVDLMNEGKVKELLVKLLSIQPPARKESTTTTQAQPEG